MVRSLYLYSLRDRCAEQGRPTSEARLGLMAGITRGEIVKLFGFREERAQQRALAAKRIDQLSQLLGKWHDEPQFSTPYGAPLDLSLQPEGSFRTFDQLIEASGIELDRDTALEALVANGCVEIHAAKFVRCKNRSFVTVGKDLSKIARLGRLGGALHSTFVHNLFRKPEQLSFFDRTMVSDFSLSEAGRNAMLAQLREDGEEFVDGMDRWVSNKAIDFKDEQGRRYGVTAFFFEDIDKAQGSDALVKWPIESSAA